MKLFESLAFNAKVCEAELESFRNLLATKDELSERDDILPFFRKSPNLSGLIGLGWPRMLMPNRIAYEFDIFGNFRADLAVGTFKEDNKRNSFIFIEFEDAKANSIFKKSNRVYKDWSTRFEHGFSQLVDWSYALEDLVKSDQFEDRFGSRRINYEMLLVIGRSQFLTPADVRRIEWRTTNITLNSRHVHFFTYDDLFEDLSYRYEILQGLDFSSPGLSAE